MEIPDIYAEYEKFKANYDKLSCELDAIKLPSTPIECAEMLINVEDEYDAAPLIRAVAKVEKVQVKRYSVSELRQIAEHLLIYCNHAEDDDK